jgi:hypothetical protein
VNLVLSEMELDKVRPYHDPDAAAAQRQACASPGSRLLSEHDPLELYKRTCENSAAVELISTDQV